MNKPLLHQGIDNHSFDANSPELIQQALDEGRIKPFEKKILNKLKNNHMKVFPLFALIILLSSCFGSQHQQAPKVGDPYPPVKLGFISLPPGLYLMRGNHKVDIGDRMGAFEDYTRAIMVNPRYADAYYNRGNIKTDLGDKVGAMADYTKALELDPNFAQAFYSRGPVKYELGDEKGALEDCTKAIKLDPNYAAAYYNRGIMKSDLGDNVGAMADYTKALELGFNNSAEAYFNRAGIKSALGDFEGEIDDYRKAIEIKPAYENAYYNLGYALYKLERFKESVETSSEGIKHFPENGELYYNRGLAREESGDKCGACQDWRRAVKLGMTEAREALADCDDCTEEDE